MLDWLIVGGGIHGTYLANLLADKVGVPLDRLTIIDPHDAPCQRWKELTAKTGMTYLRSPVVHHLDFRPNDLESYVREQRSEETNTYGDNTRPLLTSFNSHIDRVVLRSGIYSSYRIARATGISEGKECLLVDTTNGVLESRRVILAVSSNDTPRVPRWASSIATSGGFARHVFDPDFSLNGIGAGFVYAVVGSGLTAVQAALSIVRRTNSKVYLVTKGAIEIKDLDFDPCWIGPKCQKPFQRVHSYDRRRQIVDQARHKGSVPRDAARQLDEELNKGILKLIPSGAVDAKLSAGGAIELILENGSQLKVDRLVLATGFTSSAPGADWLPGVASSLGLPIHGDGFPIVDSCLRWHPRLFVTGALAELEIGAASRNIIGARIAGERIERTSR